MLQAIPLGLVTVTTAGVPAPITTALIAAAGGTLPPSGGVGLNPLSFSLDVATNGDGAYVTLWID